MYLHHPLSSQSADPRQKSSTSLNLQKFSLCYLPLPNPMAAPSPSRQGSPYGGAGDAPQFAPLAFRFSFLPPINPLATHHSGCRVLSQPPEFQSKNPKSSGSATSMKTSAIPVQTLRSFSCVHIHQDHHFLIA